VAVDGRSSPVFRPDMAQAIPDDMFDGFHTDLIEVGDVRIFVRSGGDGPPLLLLHGYPQTSAMWHRIAPGLSREFTVIAPDLRGYGASSKPPSEPDHSPYSKRTMAGDMRRLMIHLGHRRFCVLAHDRGARVAHRLALDSPETVSGMALLDIAPTREMYAQTTASFARTYWHWFFLIQPAPLPERMIGADPRGYWLRHCGAGSAGLRPFAPDAMEEYLRAFENPAAIHASCEDYRAAASIDIAHDEADQGAKLSCPLLALWGMHGAIGANFDCMELWRRRAYDVRGEALEGGHYLAEEIPETVLAKSLSFLRTNAAA